MTALAWDKTGERIYQTGVDRGVLYLQDGRAVAWNGLTSVEEDPSPELSQFYLDGVKYLQSVAPGDFSGQLKAFTYPDEFDSVQGVESIVSGLAYHDQSFQSFGLSYRTLIGNDLDGTDHGYRIHVLYDLMAIPSSVAFESLKDQSSPSEFSWSLSGTPVLVDKHRPTVHISIDTRTADPGLVATLEQILYGSPTSNARLPSIPEIDALFGSLGTLLIIDNGDGTWTAIDSADNYITMLDDTTFQIDNADATFLDASTYTISTTNSE
jgi:hypothetical protein